MAILFRFDRAQYFQGVVRVYRGDAWDLTGQVIDQVGSVALPKDLTGAGATAYFPATGGGAISAVVAITDVEQGRVRVSVDDATTPLTEIGQCQPYLVIDGIPATGHPFTAQLPQAELEISDRQFLQF